MSTKIMANAVLESAIGGNRDDLRATMKSLLDAHSAKAIAECDCQLSDSDDEDEDEDDDGLTKNKD